jgi:hypothetical protein
MRRAAIIAALAGAAFALLAATPAAAHTVGGIQPSNYRSEITGFSPRLPGVSISLYELGHRVRLTNRTGADLIVLGYYGEPFLRIGPDGAYENTRSATFLDAVEPPGGQYAAPVWRLRTPGPTTTWSDRRTYWYGSPPTGVDQSPGVVQFAVASWTIPLQTGSTVADVTGRIIWVPGPSIWPWLGLAIVLAAVAVGLALTPWWGVLLSGAVAVLVAFDAMHTWGIAAAAGGGFGSEVGRLFTAGGLSVAAWVVGLFAIDPLQRRREGGLLAAAIAGIAIAIFGGIGDATTLNRSQVPAIYPAGVVRTAVTVSLGLGIGIVVAAVVRLRSMPVAAPDDAGDAAPVPPAAVAADRP